ncbi:hypothetical protein [Candidatus Poriferisocius sp.]
MFPVPAPHFKYFAGGGVTVIVERTPHSVSPTSSTSPVVMQTSVI